MPHQELDRFLAHVDKDPSRLIFEDELTHIYNRRFLLHFFRNRVSWDTLERRPVSLVMMDLDNFKVANDTYGHQVGDRVLVWFAGLLQEQAGSDAVPVRYAGDEFMILLPEGDKKEALGVGERLLQRVRESPFDPGDEAGTLRVTVSLGVASAPGDARSGQDLVRQADTALYYAKRNGRDRIADAAEVVAEEVFPKRALYQLGDVKLVGRRQQLSQINQALKAFGGRKSQWVIVEGAPGTGKTEFLETVRRSLARSKTRQVRVNGTPLEMFRPYYLAGKLLMALLEGREDKGKRVISSLDAEALSYLSEFLPWLKSEEGKPEIEEGAARREAIFRSLLRFIPRLADERPLILYIDDLHYGDEATLLLLRRLMLDAGIPLFICGTATPSKPEAAVCLDTFLASYEPQLGIRRVVMTPLGAPEISKHLQAVFPDARIPEGFEEQLAGVTQGNPLFLCEILRKLVLDQKITLDGQRWVLQAVDADYLPQSLEEIVTQKIASLNTEHQQLLDQVSAFGEEVSLSMLIGSSEQMEGRVLDFIDQAVAEGLLSSDFHLNDETIRFLGKRILDITYGAIEPQQKEAIHQRIGNYQETLYQRRLLPSAATLAYHFNRANDREKAVKYVRVQSRADQRVFNAEEARHYAEEISDEGPAVPPLSAEDLERIPTVLRHFMSAVRNNRLYPPGSKSIVSANRQLHAALREILESNDCLELIKTKGALVVNGQRVDVGDYRIVADAFLRLLNRYVLKGITFHQGVTEKEVELVSCTLGSTQRKNFEEDFWERFSAEQGLLRVDLKQVHYAMKGKGDQATQEIMAARLSETTELRREKQKLIPEILRSLLAAARAGKLYPRRSRTLSQYVERLMNAIQMFLTQQPVFTVSKAGGSLLINGEPADASEFRDLAGKFMRFLDFVGLSSLTFLKRVSANELEIFLQLLGRLPREGAEGTYWKQAAREQGLAGILFDRHVFETHMAAQGWGSRAPKTAERISEFLEGEPEDPLPEDLFESFLEELPGRMRELLERGDEERAGQLIGKLFQGFPSRELPFRERLPDVCRAVLADLPLAHQYDFSRLLVEPVLNMFPMETEPKVLIEMGSFLQRLAGTLVEHGEYNLAGRILAGLRRRHQELKEAGDPHAVELGKISNRKLEAGVRDLVVEDLKSGNGPRQRNAAYLLENLGNQAIPLLVDIVKGEADLRARKTAVLLLNQVGSRAADELKRELTLDTGPEERTRILEVIDTFTRDLKTELACAIADEDPEVRRAAFRLAERLNDGRAIEVLLDYAGGDDPGLAVASIRSLGRLAPPEVVEDLMEILETSREEARRIACCKALARLGDPVSIDLLSGIIAARGTLPFLRKPGSGVRGAAAVALSRIAHPRAVESLAAFVNDRDPVIRQVARRAAARLQPSGEGDSARK